MLDMTYEYGGVATSIHVDIHASLDSLEDAMNTMLLAMGYPASIKVTISQYNDAADDVPAAIQAWEEEMRNEEDDRIAAFINIEPQVWDGEEPSAVEVVADLEGLEHSTLMGVIRRAWPDINPDVVDVWANGYNKKYIADELAFLAGLLRTRKSMETGEG